jgi:hypothetical protein
MQKSVRNSLPSRRLGRRFIAGSSAILSVVALAVAIPRLADAAASHNPFGYVGTLSFTNGAVALSGWAIDPDSTGPVQIQVWTDGVHAGNFSANRYRADVANTYPQYGGNHGYYNVFKLANGPHKICIVGTNIGAGADTPYACRTVIGQNNPIGVVTGARPSTTGVQVTGWVLDPNQAAPTSVSVYVDNRPVMKVLANVSVPSVGTSYPFYGANHGYDVTLQLADGMHQVCVYGWNAGVGAGNPSLGCVPYNATRGPMGILTTLNRSTTTPTSVPVVGWTLDPDTTAPINVAITVDGVLRTTLPASQALASVSPTYANYGANHEFNSTLTIDAGEHTVCVIGKNVLAGADRQIGCRLLPSTGDTTPAAPAGLVSWPGNKAADLSWTSTRSVSGPITQYAITVTPGGRVVTAAGTALRATITGLTNGAAYTFSVRATNALGTGSASVAKAVPSNIPPQFTPAPVSTSHYVRDLTGNAVTDAALMRNMGAVDASHNPSNHRYLILLQIGGQDEAHQGVVLSATSRFITYPAVVTAMRAYLDGYHSKQKAFAPLTLGIGTNNDIDVSATAGASWAHKVVNPVYTYAARYPDVTVAGANDMEPGFSGTAAQTKAWLTGYLAATGAKFVFNGSADGCSTTVAASSCNNGWTMTDLQWLGGGALPSRAIDLPQIYNAAMPLQWKFISLTGTNRGKTRLYFGGPLTEWTACGQARSCGSITNPDAWNRLWSAISSSSATKQYDMPHGTDLRIN